MASEYYPPLETESLNPDNEVPVAHHSRTPPAAPFIENESGTQISTPNRMRTRNFNNEKVAKLYFKFMYMVTEDHKSPIFCVQFNHFVKGISVFACVGSNRMSIYECLLDGKLKMLQVYADPEKTEQYFTCAWSHTDDTFEPVLAAAGLRGIIRIIRTETMACVSSFVGHGGEINELKFHTTDCNLLLSASKDYTIRLWNIKTGVCIAIFGGVEGHRDGVLSVDFNIEGEEFVSCGIDHAIKIWSLREETVYKAIQRSYNFDVSRSSVSFKTESIHYPNYSTRDVHANYIDCVQWFGSFLVSKSSDNLLKIWIPRIFDGQKIELYHDIKCENCDLWFLKFSMDFSQKILSLGNRTGKIFLWNLNTPDPALIPCSILTHIRCTTTIRHTSLNREGYVLIGVGDDGSIWRWDRILT